MVGQAVCSFADGFEAGELHAFVYAGQSNASLVTSPVHSGTYAARLNVTVGRAWLMLHYDGAASTIQRWYVNFTTLPSANAYVLYGREQSGTAHRIGIAYNAATGRFRSFAEDLDETLFGADGDVAITGNWIQLDMKITDTTVDWQVAGNAQPSGSFASISGGAIGRCSLGNQDGGTATFDCYWDDGVGVQVDAAKTPQYPIGAGYVARLVPTGVGTHVGASDFTDSGSNNPPVNPHLLVDEIPTAEADTDYVAQTTLNTASYMEYELTDLPSDALMVHGAKTFTGYKGPSAGTSGLGIRVVYGGTETTLFNAAVGVGTAKEYLRADFSPTGFPLAPSGVNGLKYRHGFSGDVTPNLRVHDVAVNVAYGTTAQGPDRATTLKGAIKIIRSGTSTLKGFIRGGRNTTLTGYIGYAGPNFRGTFTTTERDALPYNRVQDVIINLTTGYEEIWDGAAWDQGRQIVVAEGKRTTAGSQIVKQTATATTIAASPGTKVLGFDAPGGSGNGVGNTVWRSTAWGKATGPSDATPDTFTVHMPTLTTPGAITFVGPVSTAFTDKFWLVESVASANADATQCRSVTRLYQELSGTLVVTVWFDASDLSTVPGYHITVTRPSAAGYSMTAEGTSIVVSQPWG